MAHCWKILGYCPVDNRESRIYSLKPILLAADTAACHFTAFTTVSLFLTNDAVKNLSTICLSFLTIPILYSFLC